MALWQISAVPLVACACAQAPIGDVPAEDLAACEKVAAGYTGTQRITERTAIGAVSGRALDFSLRGLAIQIPKLGAAPVTLGSMVLPLALFGAANGLFEASDRRAAIVRECLRDRGVRVY